MIRHRLNYFLVFSVFCMPSPLRAAMVAPVSLAPALGMAGSVPAFRASVLAQISLVNVLSVQPVPTLSPLAMPAPTPADPWRAEAARFVVALVAQPRAIAVHQDELRAAFGDQGAGQLREASTRLQAHAAENPELAAQIENLRQGLDFNDAVAVQGLDARLNTLFENARSRPKIAPDVAAAAPDPAPKRKIPDSWKL